MVMTADRRKEIVEEFRRNDKDTGSPEVQVAMLTDRILYMTEHLKVNKKDHHSRRGLRGMVSRRNRHLRYLRRVDFDRYKGVLSFITLELQRRFGNNFSVGLAYNYYAMNLDSTDDSFTGAIEVRHHGPALFISAGF